MVTTWSKEHGHFMFYQPLLKLGNYHFCIMSERTLFYRTDNVRAKCYKSQKWEKGSAERRNARVCWLVCNMKLSRWTDILPKTVFGQNAEILLRSLCRTFFPKRWVRYKMPKMLFYSIKSTILDLNCT